MEKYYPIPQPDEISIREREDAMGAYLMMFASVAAGLPFPVLNLIAAIVYYYVNKSDSKFVNYHALHSLFAQIPVSILNSVAVVWAITIFFNDRIFDQNFKGFVITIGVMNIVYFIFSIIAAVKSRRGHFYYFIFFGKLAYHQVFYIKENRDNKTVNKPPII